MYSKILFTNNNICIIIHYELYLSIEFNSNTMILRSYKIYYRA